MKWVCSQNAENDEHRVYNIHRIVLKKLFTDEIQAPLL